MDGRAPQRLQIIKHEMPLVPKICTREPPLKAREMATATATAVSTSTVTAAAYIILRARVTGCRMSKVKCVWNVWDGTASAVTRRLVF